MKKNFLVGGAVVCLCAIIGFSVATNNQSSTTTGVNFETQSAKFVSVSCPSIISEFIPRDFTAKGFVPEGAVFAKAQWKKNTQTLICNYKDPASGQLIPSRLERIVTKFQDCGEVLLEEEGVICK